MVMLNYCFFSAWKQEANGLRGRGLCLIAGSGCLLLDILLLHAIVSQGSLDSILRKHWGNSVRLVQTYIYMGGVVWKRRAALTEGILEQWSLTGGRHSSLAMSVFFIIKASSTWKKSTYCSSSKHKNLPRQWQSRVNYRQLKQCCVCNVQTHRFALHPLSGQRAGGNSRATAKGFEPGIHDLPLVVHLNLSTLVKLSFLFCSFSVSALFVLYLGINIRL